MMNWCIGQKKVFTNVSAFYRGQKNRKHGVGEGTGTRVHPFCCFVASQSINTYTTWTSYVCLLLLSFSSSLFFVTPVSLPLLCLHNGPCNQQRVTVNHATSFSLSLCLSHPSHFSPGICCIFFLFPCTLSRNTSNYNSVGIHHCFSASIKRARAREHTQNEEPSL